MGDDWPLFLLVPQWQDAELLPQDARAPLDAQTGREGPAPWGPARSHTHPCGRGRAGRDHLPGVPSGWDRCQRGLAGTEGGLTCVFILRSLASSELVPSWGTSSYQWCRSGAEVHRCLYQVAWDACRDSKCFAGISGSELELSDVRAVADWVLCVCLCILWGGIMQCAFWRILTVLVEQLLK